jgi:hypothetical protein
MPVAGQGRQVAGTLTYRSFSLLALMPLRFPAWPALRDIGGEQFAPSGEPAVQPQGTDTRCRYGFRVSR